VDFRGTDRPNTESEVIVKRENRRKSRRSIATAVVITWQDANGQRRFCTVRGVDLSESGMKVESKEPLDVDSYVRLEAAEFGFNSAARVRHCALGASGYIIGLEFLGATTSQSPHDEGEFVDYYDLLQISPTADLETIHRVYRLVAGRYHPDNSQTGDLEKFLLLNKAFETLSDPALRAAYDAEFQSQKTAPMPVFELKEFVVGIEAEVNRRLGVLGLLYNRRRINPDKPGISLLDFEQAMTIPREHLVFTIWYLKEKHLLRTEGGSEFEITADGVEFIESSLPANRMLQRLLRAPRQATGPEPEKSNGGL
jgi:curved DNA-binding protein